MNETPTNQPPQETVPPVSVSYKVEEYPELETEHFKRHPDQAVKPEVRDCGPEVEKVEGLMAEFETKHSFVELNAITEISPELCRLFGGSDELEDPKKVENAIECFKKNNPEYVETYKAKIAALRDIVLTPDEARKFQIRRAAVKDIKVIADSIERIRKETNIASERLADLQTKHTRISNAVGFMRGNTVVHSR